MKGCYLIDLVATQVLMLLMRMEIHCGRGLEHHFSALFGRQALQASTTALSGVSVRCYFQSFLASLPFGACRQASMCYMQGRLIPGARIESLPFIEVWWTSSQPHSCFPEHLHDMHDGNSKNFSNGSLCSAGGAGEAQLSKQGCTAR